MLVKTHTSVGALLFFAGVAEAQSVRVIDKNGGLGAEFTSIQAGIDAAVSGDILLVRAGDYPEVITLGSLPLSVVAERPGTVNVESILVAQQPAGTTLLLLGLETVRALAPGLVLSDSLGTIWVQEYRSLQRVLVSTCANVVFANCEIPYAFNDLGEPSFGMHVRDSRVHLFDSRVHGGVGTGRGIPGGGGYPGEDALVVAESRVLLQGSSVLGGDGYSWRPHTGGCGEAGGDGLVVMGASSHIEVIGSNIAGGAGGTGCVQAPDGIARVILGGAVIDRPNAVRSLEQVGSILGPVREGEGLLLDYVGAPGDRIYSRIAGEADIGREFPGVVGSYLLQEPTDARGFNLDLVNSDRLVFTPFGSLPNGVLGRVSFAQMVHLNMPTHEVVLGSPRAFVHLDSSL